MLSVKDVVVRFGGVVALDGPTFEVGRRPDLRPDRAQRGGQTRLFDCVSRLVAPSAGAVRWRGEDLLARPASEIAGLGIARTFQNLGRCVAQGARERHARRDHRAGRVPRRRAVPAVRRPRGAPDRARGGRAARAPRLEDVAGRPAAALAYGRSSGWSSPARCSGHRPPPARRAGLRPQPRRGRRARGHAASLRDELGLTLLLVEHHMGLVMRVSEQVVVLDFGRVIAAEPARGLARDPGVGRGLLGTPA